MALSTTWIIVIAVGCGAVIVVGIVVAIIFFCCLKKSGPRSSGYRKLDMSSALNRAVGPASEPQSVINERALMNARFIIRALDYELTRPLFDIGRRSKTKYFFIVKSLRSQGEKVMSMVKRSSLCDLVLNIEAGRRTLNNILQAPRHPYITRILDSDYIIDKGTLVVFRDYSREGSLKDLIYQAVPETKYDLKYNKQGKPLSNTQIAVFSRQILEALKHLEDSGFPYTHLHTGNVIVQNGIAKLSDLENAFMYLPRHYENIFKEFAKSNPESFALADLNVIAFGCVLYEMVTGSEMRTMNDLKTFPSNKIPHVTNVLHSIFYSSREKIIPSVEQLILQKPFKQVKLDKKLKIKPIAFQLREKEMVKRARKHNSKVRIKDKGAITRKAAKSPAQRKRRAKQSAAKSLNGKTSVAATSPSAPKRVESSSSAPAPPPPPPPVSSPPPQQGRGAMLASIRALNDD